MKHYSGDYAQQVAFPLSGIGSGGISISGIGALVDWELDGKANKCSVNEYTNFALKAERNGKVVDTRILRGDLTADLAGTPWAAHHHSWGYGQGPNRTTLAGLAHCRQVDFSAEFPFANLEFADERMPAVAKLRAFNPFIPLDEDNSSLPAAFFDWEITNTSDERTDYTLAFSVGNPYRISDGGFNKWERSDGINRITLSSKNYERDTVGFGELCVSTDCEDVSGQEYWYRSGWFDDLTTFWREFSSEGRLKNRHYDDNDRHGQLDIGDMCTLCAHVSLNPGESGRIRFVLSWYYPVFVKYWDSNKPSWKHEYCRRFSSVDDVTAYCYENRDMLTDKSARFAEAMRTSTLPEVCEEAAADTLAVLKSPTCLRLENGEFWAFEGTGATNGSCEGTCDHVWGYQYALAFLFPRLARQVIETDLTYNMKESGEMMFRTMIPLGSSMWNFRACVDGQMGLIMRFYREWKLSGDDEWLKKWWGSIKKALEYAWSPDNRDLWDPEKSGVITGRQHHTLDVELFGPSSWLTGYYLGALKACAEIAAYLGQDDKAKEYADIFAHGSAEADRLLFNGRYYTQKVDVKDKSVLERFLPYDGGVVNAYWNFEKNEIKYQYAAGSEIDQLVGQWHATLMGLGDIFDPAHRKTAAKSMYEINFKSMRDVFNPCRIFAVNDERGMMMCEWPEGEYKPQIPIPYTEECMTGFEYAAAGLMLEEGMVDEGISVVDGIRDRYDGKKRNPFAEIECGSSYARSMAAFSLFATFSGYRYDMAKGEIGFAFPDMKNAGTERKFFWSVSEAWGVVTLSADGKKIVLEKLDGDLTLNGFILPEGFNASEVSTCHGAVDFKQQGSELKFAAETPICTLTITA